MEVFGNDGVFFSFLIASILSLRSSRISTLSEPTERGRILWTELINGVTAARGPYQAKTKLGFELKLVNRALGRRLIRSPLLLCFYFLKFHRVDFNTRSAYLKSRFLDV